MFYPTFSYGCAMSSYIKFYKYLKLLQPVYTTQWNGSYCSVNGCGTVLNRTTLGETVPPWVGGPNQFRTSPFASDNDTARKLLFTPLVSCVTG